MASWDRNCDRDLDYARRLQEEYDREAAADLLVELEGSTQKTSSDVSLHSADTLDTGLSPVDPSLEFTDPNPEIRTLFLQYNIQYFWGKLSGIEVKWSPRMTLCAGLCVYEGKGGLCSVRLSLPLLKLRPRKDLVETLLHEMIHAYLFITQNDTDHDGHGPQFQKHMHRINKATGASISIYHTFNDEVALYQQHWWRCDGPCRKRPPYYGYVKRAMNRAPSSRDFWWAEHRATCGGQYTKIKEPEGYGQKKNKKINGKEGKVQTADKDIRSFYGGGNVLGSSHTNGRNINTTSTFSRDDAVPTMTKDSPICHQTKVNGDVTRNGAGRLPEVKSGSSLQTAVTSQAGISPLFSHITSNAKSSQNPAENISKKGTAALSSTPVFTEPDEDDVWLSQIDDPDPTAQTSSENNSCGKRQTHSDIVDLTEISSSFNKHKSKESFPVSNVNRKKRKPFFRENFVSVCLDKKTFPNSSTRKKEKKVYVFDDVDSNEDLWEESVKDEHIRRKEDKEMINLLHKHSPVKVINTDNKDANLKGCRTTEMGANRNLESAVGGSSSTNENKTCESETGQVCSVYQNELRGTGIAEEVGPLSSLNSKFPASSTSQGGFYGQGHRLGNGTSGSSFLSQIRATFHQRSDTARKNAVRSEIVSRPELPSGVGNNSSSIKRSSTEAFGSENNNSISVFSKRRSAVTGQDRTAGGFGDVEHERTEAVHQASVSPSFVSCPVCNARVEAENINTHLDECLVAE